MPPLQPVVKPNPDCLETERAHAARGSTPLWIPWPLPPGWVVTGFGHAGDERSGAVATMLGCSGPAPLGGPADMLLIAETPGVGLAARLAGLPGSDPGDGFDDGPAHAKVDAAGHPTPMWSVDAGPEVAVFVGEAKAAWMWALLWPAAAGVLMLENLGLHDLVVRSLAADIPFGALMPRLTALRATDA